MIVVDVTATIMAIVIIIPLPRGPVRTYRVVRNKVFPLKLFLKNEEGICLRF